MSINLDHLPSRKREGIKGWAVETHTGRAPNPTPCPSRKREGRL